MTANDRALVTGASSGIGLAFAERLARDGHDLVLVARSGDKLTGIAQRLESQHGVTCEVLQADLADDAGMAAVEKRLSAEPGISILINNAGLGSVAPFVETTRDDIRDMITVNVMALTRLTYAAVPAMIERGGGTIINVASGLAFAVLQGSAVYGATKAFVAHFTETLHEEVGQAGIRLQALIPGLTRTNLGNANDTGFFDRFPPEVVMLPEDLVDTSLASLAMGELFCFPRLEDPEEWTRASAAIRAVGASPPSNRPAARYKIAAKNEG